MTDGPWYQHKDRLAAEIAAHETITAVAVHHGIPPTTLFHWARRHGLKGKSKFARHTDAGPPPPPAPATEPGTPPPPAEPAEVVAYKRRLERADAEVKSLRAQLKHANQHANIVDDVRDMLAPVIAAAVLPRPKPPARSRNTKRKPITFVWHFNDLHFDEIVDPAVINDVNAYSPGIAARRVQHTVDTIIKLAETYGNVDEIVLAVNGDTFGGAIHPESAEYAARVGRQMLNAALIVAQVAYELACHFATVRVLGTVGNHTRSTTKMPTGSARVDTSWELAMHEQARSLLIRAENVTYDVARGYTLTTKIGPDVWAFSHGDAARGGGGQLGIPAYGLKRQHDANREWSLVLAQMTNAAADSVVKHSRYAHFHTLFYWQAGAATIGLMPSPKGTDSYVKDALGRYGPPQFVVEVVHPDHGLIGSHTIDLTAIVTEESDCRYVWNQDAMIADTFTDWTS